MRHDHFGIVPSMLEMRCQQAPPELLVVNMSN